MSVSRNFPIVGISLIEVLVALVIFSEAALGLIGLQQKSIQATESANWHNHAASIARDVIERIRANPSALLFYQGDWRSTRKIYCDQWSAPCSPLRLALADRVDLYLQAQHLLPAPAIQVASCARVTCVVVSWLTSRNASDNGLITTPAHSKVMTFWLGS